MVTKSKKINRYNIIIIDSHDVNFKKRLWSNI